MQKLKAGSMPFLSKWVFGDAKDAASASKNMNLHQCCSFRDKCDTESGHATIKASGFQTETPVN